MKYLSAAIVLTILSTPLAAQEFECKPIESEPTRAVGNGIASPQALMSDADFAAGYVVTGGGCNFDAGYADNFGSVIWSKPVAGGYACKARAPPDGILATATATLCRVKDVLRRPPFNSVGQGGGTVAIARAAQGAIPYSLRICNFSGGPQIQVDLTAEKRTLVEPGKCLEVDKPQTALFRSTTGVAVSGVYDLFQPGTFPAEPRVGSRTVVGNDKHVAIIGPMLSASAKCQKPRKGEPFNLQSYKG